MLNVIVGNGTLGVMAFMSGTWFDNGECPGVVGTKDDSREKVVFRNLLDVAFCDHSREALRSDAMFCNLLIPFE